MDGSAAYSEIHHVASDTASSHWEAVYRAKPDSELRWHQEEPAGSRELIGECSSAGAALIDVGGGSSMLAGRLAEDGLSVIVLDISASAIERAKRQERRGQCADHLAGWQRDEAR
jgi:2-polyprenyl-3-methyl-5-hydroxy-6-metoxy-1,4-benzoquinol methylase